MKAVLVFCILIAASQAFLSDWFKSSSDPDWNGLVATYNLNLFNGFYYLPRTVSDAKSKGWTLDTSAGSCAYPGRYSGNRYRKTGDQGVMLLFDRNGYIAGIQSGIPKTNPTYPSHNNNKFRVFNEEKDMWVVTAYFTEPATICTRGRDKSAYEKEGTGSMLAIQMGPTPSTLMKIPMEENRVTSLTKFVEGKCAYTMGKHYWYDFSEGLSCLDTFPVFLLYNEGKLNGFGWVFNPYYTNSHMWEHPPRSDYDVYIKEPPQCLGTNERVTSLHIFLTNNPALNLC